MIQLGSVYFVLLVLVTLYTDRSYIPRTQRHTGKNLEFLGTFQLKIIQIELFKLKF